MQLIVEEETRDKEKEVDGKLERRSFRVEQEDKFYRRLLSKENSSSASCPSFRVYYTVASGTVPFDWETRPGTPKNTDDSSNFLPPLTPPPSYLYHHSAAPQSCSTTATGLCMNGSTSLFSRLKRRKSHSRYSPPRSSSSSISSAHLSPLAPSQSLAPPRQTRFSSSTSSLSSMGGVDEDGSEAESPRSTLCFRTGSRRFVLLRKMMTSIAGHGRTPDVPTAPKNVLH